MALVDELMELEKALWTGDRERFERTVDERCLLAFTKMAGVMNNEEVASTVSQGPRWEDPEIEVQGFLEPVPHFAVLTYRARARRPEGEPYTAVVSSGYVERDGAWKLAFHQQTPSG